MELVHFSHTIIPMPRALQLLLVYCFALNCLQAPVFDLPVDATTISTDALRCGTSDVQNIAIITWHMLDRMMAACRLK